MRKVISDFQMTGCHLADPTGVMRWAEALRTPSRKNKWERSSATFRWPADILLTPGVMRWAEALRTPSRKNKWERSSATFIWPAAILLTLGMMRGAEELPSELPIGLRPQLAHLPLGTRLPYACSLLKTNRILRYRPRPRYFAQCSVP